MKADRVPQEGSPGGGEGQGRGGALGVRATGRLFVAGARDTALRQTDTRRVKSGIK